MIKIIFFDIDGTLIDLHTKQMSSATKDALLRLQSAGIKICVATGRTPANLPVLAGIPFDVWLTMNGSYCFDASGPIFCNPLPGEAVEGILENAKKQGISLTAAVENSGVFTRIPAEEIEGGTVYQLMCQCPEEACRAVLEGVSGAKMASWWSKAVDIMPADGGKGRAIREILAYFGLERSEAMAFGDGNNDMPMLQVVGTGVAMGNASDNLKAMADDVCGDVSQDGIYHYCLEHGLI
jgi:HAD superfamily hydrolase (TIGR01484 family)